MTDFYARHEALLKRAIEAIGARAYFSAYPESASPKVYGETAKAEGDAAFEALLGKTFVFDDRHPSERLVGAEASPYGKALDLRYPTASVDKLDCGQRRGGRGLGARLGRDPRRRRARNACAAQQAELPHRRRGAAHVRPVVEHGVPGGRPARPGSRSRGGRLCGRGDEPRAARDAVGEAAGQGRADPPVEALPRRAARRRGRHRLHDLPDLEPLPRPVREPRHRQFRHRQAASGGDPAGGDHAENHARGLGRGGLRSQRRAARSRRTLGADRKGSRAASGGEDRRFHRGPGVRLVAAPVAERQARLHRGSRRQRDRHRFRREFPRHVRQHRLLAVALFRPDVHGAAEHLRAERPASTPTKATRASTRSPRESPQPSTG